MQKTQISSIGRTSIALGKQGENGVREILFPQFGDWISYKWVLNHQRATDKAAYPCPLEKRGTTLVWVVTAGDTEVPGTGLLELTCYGDSGEVLKSQTWTTTTQKSPAPGGPVPDPVEPWFKAWEAMLNRKMDEPGTEGSPGQHLATDGHGGRYWADGGWPQAAAELLVKILSAGTYAEDQTENINALARMLGVEVNYLTALLGDALVGEMILGT